MIRAAKARSGDLTGNADEPHTNKIAKKHEEEEQPVHSVKNAPNA